MRNPARTPFGVIFYTELLLNSKRIVPYALLVLFSAHAVMWWGWSAAANYGWATNSDFNIVRNLLGFSFLLGLPIFNAVIMGDPVIRDFRTGVDPLIFSKPVRRAPYLLGKFFGNFFVLVCCQAAFVLTTFALQWFPKSNLVVQPPRILPYFKHFLFFVVISHLLLAAVYFTVGALTRNAKIVYGLAVSFYPLYIAYQLLLLKVLPERWALALDPMLLRSSSIPPHLKWEDANLINQIVVSYDADMIANRALMLLVAALCLMILYFRFRIAERPRNAESFATLDLSTGVDRLYYDAESVQQTRGEQSEKPCDREQAQLPEVAMAGAGGRANFYKLIAALGVEFRLLRAERSLVVIIPLALFLSVLELAFYEVHPDISYEVSYAAAYASSAARSLLLFLFGITVFYTGEAMHRDREVKVEPLLWSAPAPSYVLLLSKFLATVLLGLALSALVALVSLALQIYKGRAPFEITPYLLVYTVILVPSVIFIAAASVLLNVALRDKYLAYAVSIATGGGLLYLYNQGYNHWLYNPLLHQRWTYAELSGAANSGVNILTHRVYVLAIAALCLALAHLCFGRKASKGFGAGRGLGSAGWSILAAAVSVFVALCAVFLIIQLQT
ncbi:MAG TPA: ABC transporter permease [Pyrinomonadaceae bacterium]|jgi:ABC-type transport system involved in multi-copper enzyme maturation permease subunit|nr:ABC transporter permease [Pyrinomonadaceae bacterium]